MKIATKRGTIDYVITINNKEYHVSNIHFYKDNEIFISTERGCLEYKDEKRKYTLSMDEIELPVEEIKLKRKVNFDGKVFIVSEGRMYGKLRCELYIPSDMLNIHYAENILSEDKECIEAIYRGLNDIYINKYVKYVRRYVYDKLENIKEQFGEISRCINKYSLEESPKDILEKLDELNPIVKSYIEEKERIDNLTIDDIDMADVEEFYSKE